MYDYLLFAGTSEGRKIAEFAKTQGLRLCVFTATEYGSSLIETGGGLDVHSGRLAEQDMEALFLRERGAAVIDATHPYAAEVSANIRSACRKTGLPYIRVIRKSADGFSYPDFQQPEGSPSISPSEKERPHPESGEMTMVHDISEAVRFLSGTEGNILVTTGSKELSAFRNLPDYQNRVYARVLSLPKVVEECGKMGFIGVHLIAMQGPFSMELNLALLHQINAKWMVTKESGRAGGFEEKCRAAAAAGCRLIVIGRPVEEHGITVEQCIDRMLSAKEKHADREKTEREASVSGKINIHTVTDRSGQANEREKKNDRQIALIGTGMHGAMTEEAAAFVRRADLLIGASRMVNEVRSPGQRILSEYRPERILQAIRGEQTAGRIAVLYSGDTGFFSGASGFLKRLPDDNPVRIYPGISSLSYFCAKIGVSWEDMKILSLHGQECNVTGHVMRNRKTFCILGKKDDVSRLCAGFLQYGQTDLQIFVGERLGFPEERIERGGPADFAEREFDPLSVIVILNPHPADPVGFFVRDDAFLRGKVPMTKEEVRKVSLCKMGILQGDTLYDIGAGTGSLSIEMALANPDGAVYAIERSEEAVRLLEQNRIRFCADNLHIIRGSAPEALRELPVPDRAFIGGTSGNMRAILRQLRERSPRIRVVINAITLETVHEALDAVREAGFGTEETVCVTAAKAKKVGSYHMMMGQNPVYIITAGPSECN